MNDKQAEALATMTEAMQRLGPVMVELDSGDRTIVRDALQALADFTVVTAFDAWSNALEAAGVSLERQVEIAARVALEIGKTGAMMAAT